MRAMGVLVPLRVLHPQEIIMRAMEVLVPWCVLHPQEIIMRAMGVLFYTLRRWENANFSHTKAVTHLEISEKTVKLFSHPSHQ